MKIDAVTPFPDPRIISETQWQRVVIDYATLRGWRVHHTRPAQNRRGKWSTPIQGHPGFPDLFMARNGELLLVELKTEKGTLTADQKAWSEQVAGGPLLFHVWRPSMWIDIARWLT